MFEDEAEDVGSDIDSYCPKCKLDTAHTVITKYEDEIRRVQCSVCGDVHSYRKPRGEVEDDVPEPAAAKRRAQLKKPSWAEARERASARSIANARPYSIRDTYAEGDVITHPKFNLGFVTEITENKVEVTFEDERRLLIHNRPDLASAMPAIAQIPLPREGDKKKKRGQKAAAEIDAGDGRPTPPQKGAKGGKGKGAKVAPPPPPAAPALNAKAAAAGKGGKPAPAKPPAKPAKPAKPAASKKAKPAAKSAKPAAKKTKAAAKKSAKPAAKKAKVKKRGK